MFSARYRYHCHNSDNVASSRNVPPHNGTEMNSSRRTPTVSITRPTIGANSPTVPTATENPAETAARDHPNSRSNGSTYSPNAPNEIPSETTSANTTDPSTHHP